MPIWINILLGIAGLVLLQQGAGWFIKGSSGLARKFRVPELTIGLTVVAFGTSAPELVVNLAGTIKGNVDVVYGNIIGSNNFNLFVILGLVGLIGSIKVKSSTAWKEIPISFGAAGILFLLANDAAVTGKESILSRLDGLLLLFFFALFLYYAFRQLKKDKQVESHSGKNTSNARIIVFILLGLGGLVLGGKLVLDNAVIIASSLGMSERMIGLTIVAAGTSLPELATSLMAAVKRNFDIAVGNIIGSNIFNILFILGTSALVRPLEYNGTFNKDIALLSGGTILLLIAMYTGKRKQIDRWEALFLLAGYVVFFILFAA
jgi:cation:H+ antiporter